MVICDGFTSILLYVIGIALCEDCSNNIDNVFVAHTLLYTLIVQNTLPVHM